MENKNAYIALYYCRRGRHKFAVAVMRGNEATLWWFADWDDAYGAFLRAHDGFAVPYPNVETTPDRCIGKLRRRQACVVYEGGRTLRCVMCEPCGRKRARLAYLCENQCAWCDVETPVDVNAARDILVAFDNPSHTAAEWFDWLEGNKFWRRA